MTFKPYHHNRRRGNVSHDGTVFPIRRNQLSGLGITTDQGVQAAAVAVNAIPGVGQIASAILSIGDAIFGGGDPTPLSQLIDNIVQLRNQIAKLHNQLGAVDTFTIPQGYNPQDKAGVKDLVDGIVEETLGTTEAAIQDNRRSDYYATIKALQPVVTQLQQQVHDQALIASVSPSPVQTQSQPANVSSLLAPNEQPIYVLNTSSAPTNAASDASGTNTPTDYTPLWIIGGVAAMVGVFALASRG